MNRLIASGKLLPEVTFEQNFSGRFLSVSHRSESAMFVDLVNTNIQLNSQNPDRSFIIPSQGGTAILRLPSDWKGQNILVRFYDADAIGTPVTLPASPTTQEGVFAINVPPFRLYGSIVATPSGATQPLPTTRSFQLMALSGSYLFARNGGGIKGNGSITADGIVSGPNTAFVYERQPTITGPLRDGERIRIRTSGGYYVTAECAGGALPKDDSQEDTSCGQVSTDRTEGGPWETFIIRKAGATGQDPEIRQGDKVSIRTSRGYFLSIEGATAEGSYVVAKRRAPSPSSRFEIRFPGP